MPLFHTKTETRLLQKIRSEKMSDKEKENLYKELTDVQKNRKFGKSVTVFKKMWKIMVAYSFFAVSLIVIVDTYWENIVKPLFYLFPGAFRGAGSRCTARRVCHGLRYR